MRLFHSPTSPFARKVMICAILRGLDSRIDCIPTNPWSVPADLAARNPLSMVPCLVTDDGVALFDSRVICEYLDSLGDAPPLFPRSGDARRWQALQQQALADGLMDAAIRRRMEQAHPKDEARAAFVAAQAGKMARALDALEADPPVAAWHIGTIAIACALSYLDFRFAADAWQDARPLLAAWYAVRVDLPVLRQTAPA